MNTITCSFVQKKDFFFKSYVVENYIYQNTDLKFGDNQYFDGDSLTLIKVNSIIDSIVDAIDQNYFTEEEIENEVSPFLYKARKLPKNTYVNLESIASSVWVLNEEELEEV